MSSETDPTRQRTVAELLAQHGESGARGRRRRQPDADPDPSSSEATAGTGLPPVGGRRGQRRSAESATPPAEAGLPADGRVGRYVRGLRPTAGQGRESSTDVMPRVGPAPDSATGPIAAVPATRFTGGRDVQPDDPDADGGPPTAIGTAPAGAEEWHRIRTANGGRPVGASDGGPPTQATPLADDPAGLGPDDLADDDPEGGHDADSGGSYRRGDGSGQAWAAMVAQWIAGAVGGAALWVGFRLLWRSLPVVAVSAAVLVTVGLVVTVRALLRNDDMRTTIFAVLVGLLLTVSPAVLVLIGR